MLPSERIANLKAETEKFTEKLSDDSKRLLEDNRDLFKQTLSQASTKVDIEQSREMHTFLKGLSEPIQSLLAEPFTELTRKRQERLLVISALCLLVSQGLAFVQKLGIFGAELEASSSWATALAASIATIYFLIAFVASYIRDIRIHRSMRIAPTFHLDSLQKESYSVYADKLQVQLIAFEERLAEIERAKIQHAEGEAIPKDDIDARLAHSSEIIREMNSSSPAQAKIDAAKAEIEVITKRLDLIFGVVENTKFVDRIRLWVELWLPIAIALLAIAMGIKYVYFALWACSDLINPT